MIAYHFENVRCHLVSLSKRAKIIVHQFSWHFDFSEYKLFNMAKVLFLVVLVGIVHSGVSQNCGGRQCTSDEYCKDGVCTAKLPLDETCTGIGQCKAMYSECAGEDGAMTCQCNSQWTPGPEEQCILNCESSNCPKNSFCSGHWHGCLLQPALNQPCDISETNSLQCKNQYASCKTNSGNSTCTCDFQEEFGICVPGCSEDSSRCRPEAEFCEASSGECKHKKPLGQSCSGTNECMPEFSECGTGNVCSCTAGFRNHLDIDCLPECANNGDCTRTSEYCDLGERYCVIKANLNRTCHFGSQDPCATPNAECKSSGFCLCTDSYVENRDTTTCLKEATKIGDECREGQQCHSLAPGESYATECTDNSCSCSSDYVANSLETECLKMAKNLLDTCKEDKQCESLLGLDPPSKCNDGKCSCPTGFVESSDLQTCLKGAEKIGDECQEIQQCFSLAPGDNNATECLTNKTCSCTKEYVENGLETKCLKLAAQVEDPCEENQQCSVLGKEEEVECKDEKCSCKPQFYGSEDKKSCLKSHGARMESGLVIFAAVLIKYFAF